MYKLSDIKAEIEDKSGAMKLTIPKSKPDEINYNVKVNVTPLENNFTLDISSSSRFLSCVSIIYHIKPVSTSFLLVLHWFVSFSSYNENRCNVQFGTQTIRIQKHLRRYAEMYNVVGVNAVTFAVSVDNVIGFDFGRKLERRVCQEVVEWVERKEEDGRERVVMFHTFSNTGWFAYVVILGPLKLFF
ncbi:transmembrane protein 53 [Tanacetum coccineum]